MAQTWGPIGEAVEALKGLFRRADQEAIRNRGEVPESLQAEIEKSFRAFLAFINECAGDHSGLSDSVRYEIGARLQQELLPYLLLTQTAERWYSKPRGYAGDFLTIEWIYRNEPKGTGRLGPLLDRCFLSVAAAQAVRNRRSLLAEHIRDALDRSRGRTAQVTSLACGPAAEIFDAYAELQNPERLRATLIDIDFQALAFVSDKCNRLNLNRFVQLVNGNLVYLATGRQELELSDQDLVYSIGLIDYFNDQFVVTLLDYVHDLLRPGGRVVLGNFESRNPDKAMMDHILDWKLIHRTEDDMNRLFKASRFGRECTDIRYEAAGVNLFAECVRQD